jgi:hypothetical protein
MKIKGILLAAALVLNTGCGLQKAVDSAGATSDKLDDTLKQMKEMNGVVKDQCQEVAFESMLKPEFGQDLMPIPFDLMPFAKKFGTCSSTDDLTEVVYLWMKKMNELVIDTGPSGAAPTADQVNAFNHHKMQIFMALEAVSGLLEQDKVNKIIADQIDGEGRYQETALQLLMLRTRFLRDVMLESSLFSTPLNNPGKISKAIEYADQIDAIARLPYAKGAIKIKITGFMDPYPVIDETFDPGVALDTWTKIRTKAQRCFGQTPMPDTCNPPGVHDKLSLPAKAQLDSSLSYVDKKIVSWGGSLN